MLIYAGADSVDGFWATARILWPGRRISSIAWVADDGLDSLELRLGHMMRRGGQQWRDLMGMSFREFSLAYSALSAYVRAENKAGGGGLD